MSSLPMSSDPPLPADCIAMAFCTVLQGRRFMFISGCFFKGQGSLNSHHSFPHDDGFIYSGAVLSYRDCCSSLRVLYCRTLWLGLSASLGRRLFVSAHFLSV